MTALQPVGDVRLALASAERRGRGPGGLATTRPMLEDDAKTVPDDANATAATEYTIDELAVAARVPSRTIRFYQAKGALPKPKIRGRVAYYGPEHIERLKLIGSLQDRGLRIRAIRDLLTQADKGELALNEWLGLEQQLQEPWANDRPRVVNDAELAELLGARPGAAAELLRAGQIERMGDSYLIKSPALLNVSLRLEAGGIDFETAIGASAILRKHMHRATEDLAAFFYKNVGKGFGRDLTATDLSDAYRALRPHGLEAVSIVFAQEMERTLRKLVGSGATSSLPARAKRKKHS